MAVKLNPDKKIVAAIKEGLKDIALAEFKRQRIINACARNSGSR